MCNVKKLLLQIITLGVIAKNCDGSVLGNYVRISRQSSGCVLPDHPEFGQWSIFQQTTQLLPSQVAPSGTILQISCRDNRKLNGDATIVCLGTKWTTSIGQCLQTCSPRHSTSVMTVTCTHNERTLETCTEPIDGTVARFQCADFYEDQNLERHPIHVCFNGRWSHSLPECVPICGQKTNPKDPTLIVGGKNATRGNHPWQVALYNATDKNLLCGGSLLNQRVILTAAHCITNDKGTLESKEIFMVAVGKYFRNYHDSRDFEDAQFSPIHEMYVPKQFKGEVQNFFGDVALLITKKTFVLSNRVQPVCIDWAFRYHQALLDPTRVTHGYVSGWGFTVEYKQPSPILKELEVPLISEQECTNKLPDDYTKFLTDDKLCAGFLDSGTSVCQGDSGGGLVTKYGSRFYVVGVVSLSPQAPTAEGGCDSQQYALYTRVSYYIQNFILEKEAQFRPSNTELISCKDDPSCKIGESVLPEFPTTTVKPDAETSRFGCVLPEHPISGQWSVYGTNSKFSPGMTVSTETILKVSCNKGYRIGGVNVVLCESGKWSAKIGQCLKSCPTIRDTKSTAVTCSFKDEEMEDCSNPFDGTIARHKCAPFYENLQLAKNPVRVCRNGSWDLSIPECVPICGQKSVTATTLIVNGKTPEKTDYPWQVAIYREPRKQFICGGTLISQKLILTAAHCVTNPDGNLRPKEHYVVAVGKFYSDYYDPLDHEAQFSDLEDIFTPPPFTGINGSYLGDIAVLVAKNAFTLSKTVQPVCVDWGLKYLHSEKLGHLTGFVTGWGFTATSARVADALQELEVPTIPIDTCLDALPDSFVNFLTHDKFCAGYFNLGTSVCNGDAGGSLITKHDDRYYITGIVSVAPSLPDGRACDSNSYALYTNVSNYNDFILQKDALIKSRDMSDCQNTEDPNSCQTTTVAPTSPATLDDLINQVFGCVLPHHPSFGKWSVPGAAPSDFAPGHNLPSGKILQISCYQSHKLVGDSVILCDSGKWSSSVGKCLRTCPSLNSTATSKVTCTINDKEIENCTNPIDGTRIKYECAPFYEDLQFSQNPFDICKNGKWSRRPPNCLPVCGQKSVSAQILIINGKTVKKGDYPWHVGLYRGTQKEFVCSGALVSPSIILTAAHCVTNFNGTAYPESIFTIAAGKYYRKFDDQRETAADVQTSGLQSIMVHSQFKGVSKSLASNIAALITKKPLALSLRVQPVCIDWNFKYTLDIDKQNANITGYVTGWGYTTEKNKPSDELQELELPINSNEKCREELPKDFVQRDFTPDKFCAGYRNKSTAVCRGDSGGALVAKFSGRFYITGLVSNGPSVSGDCDSQNYALYTKISSYINDFILHTFTLVSIFS